MDLLKNKKDRICLNRVILKNITSSDRDSLLSIVKDPLIKKTYMLPDLTNKDEEDKLFNRLKDLTESKDYFAYGIYLNETIIGYLNSVEIKGDEIEIGYFVSSSYWNQGFATEVIKGTIKELFRLGFNTIVAAHFENNLASGKVMVKAGMRKIDRTESIKYRGTEYKCIYYAINK